jgi:hypothetical protein
MKRKRYKWGFDMYETTSLSRKIRNKSELEQKKLMKKILKKEPKRNPFAEDILHCARMFKGKYKEYDQMKLPKKVSKLLLVEEEVIKSIRTYWKDDEYSGLMTDNDLVKTKYLWRYIQEYNDRYGEVINLYTLKIGRLAKNEKLISELKQLRSTTKISSVSNETELYFLENESHKPTIGGVKIEQNRRNDYLETSMLNEEMNEEMKLQLATKLQNINYKYSNYYQ